ncbi:MULTISPECIES: VIT1/CCC1 transporter family protein [unclassified Curtobacterium]|uniref:VIT1/CCC1 transporter family protein n=1 Tax=unclassified Curtobacterium TaxID=257496 RepID=UPI0011139F36|nr:MULTISPECIES: VIT1/CCC1 transporter family protein [unclassified Curtobacterium]WIA95956.1 VIT1/CCC1 transporter family protein [Curtobacterium sp. MCBA15_004]WIA99258.1 VIT1/CCC1 transporter family protein [Curtobacterium sp. MCBA15_012]
MSTATDLSLPVSEHDDAASAARLNWLRAGLLGANDGIVSVAAVLVGVAGAGASTGPVVAAGTAALVGGAVSMALGEYVSVSGARDAQRTGQAAQQAQLEADAEDAPTLAAHYRSLGVDDSVADAVARELTRPEVRRRRAAAALRDAEDEVVSPWRAAWVSAATFTVGALLPFVALLLAPEGLRVPVTVVAVLVALAVTGTTGATLGGARRGRAAARVLVGGALALAATYAAGALLGTHAF